MTNSQQLHNVLTVKKMLVYPVMYYEKEDKTADKTPQQPEKPILISQTRTQLQQHIEEITWSMPKKF